MSFRSSVGASTRWRLAGGRSVKRLARANVLTAGGAAERALALAEALELLDERGAANLEEGGGAVLVAAGLLQRFCDELALHPLQRGVEVHAVRADGGRGG